ncbi:PD-(D/E)XK nuclease family protein [Acidobacteriota bacterium]
MSDKFEIERLKIDDFFLIKFFSHHRLDEKLLIVPSYQIGNLIGEALTRSGHPWVNLRFVTLPSLAMEIVGAELSSQGLKQISPMTSRMLINLIFRELKDSGDLEYYGELEAQSGIIDAVYWSILDLRAAGISSADIRSGQFIDEQKGRETMLILRKYEEKLEDGKLFDISQLYEAATKIARESSTKTGRLFLCLDNQILSKTERDFLDSLTQDLALVPYGQVFEMPRPRRMLPAGKWTEKSQDHRTDLERAPWLFALKEAPAPFKDNTLSMFQAIGPTNECREVIRRILAEKAPFDHVEIIHPYGSLYPSIFSMLSKKTGFKFTSAEGLSFSFTTPGKVYSGLIRWIENEYPSADFCSLLESEFLKTPKGEKDEPLSFLKVSRVIKDAKIGWGKNRYVSRLKALYEEKRSKTGGKEAGSLKTTMKITAWIQSILELFPSGDEAEMVEITDLCRGIATFLKKYCRVRDEVDGEALGMITSRLDEASSFKILRLPRDEVLEWLSSFADTFSVGASGTKPGHIHLSTFHSGGYTGRPHSFIVGLDQGSIPGSRLPDPILLDEEREAISPELVVTSDKLRENLYSMTTLLSSLKGKATLSFSSYDVIEERQSFPSSFLLQVHRLNEGDPTLDYSSLKSSLGTPSGFIPSSSKKLDETDWWLDFIASDGEFKDAVKSIKENFCNISQGEYARTKRIGPDLTSFDGIVTSSDEEFHPCFNPNLAMSASRIEKLARCPYGYFLRYILDIQPPEEIVLDKAQWLDGLQFGTLIHDILCVFMRGLRDKGEAVKGEKNRAEIRAVAMDVLDRFREENPPPSEVFFEREKKDIFTNLDIFLKAEDRRDQKVQPILFEVNFGYKGDEGEGIAEVIVFELEPGKTIRLNGRIDRIDRIDKDNFRVIDYKTGKYAQYEGIKELGMGKYLQHALYAVAAEDILKSMRIALSPDVSLSGYAFPTSRGDGREILIKNFDRMKLKSLLLDLFVFFEKGCFLVNPKAQCDFCDYKVLCGKGVIERTKEKKETNASEFGLFDKLEEYE